MVVARSRPSGPGRARRLVGALIAVALGASFAQSTLPADAGAQGIPALDCSGNTIYQFQRASTGSTTGRLNSVNVAPLTPGYTGPVTATQVTTSLVPATSPGGNALGISEGGQGAWALAPQTPGGSEDTLTFTLREFNTATNAWTQRTASINTEGRLPSGVTAASIRSQGIVAGAVDPRSGNFFWAYLSNAPRNAMVIFGFNTTTNEPIGVVANSNLPQGATTGTAGSNGDIAFDGAGNLFVVSNTGTNAAVGVIAGPLPTTEQPTTPTLDNERLTPFENPADISDNGIAFNAVGDLYIQWSVGGTDTYIQRLNPQTGDPIAGPSTVTVSPPGGGIGVDLGGCATPPTMELQKNVVARRADTDQFRLEIAGGGLTEGNTGTTRGTAPGVQDQPGETAGPVVARVGTEYTFTETAAGTTDLANYGTGRWRCVDRAADDTEVARGTGRTFTFTPASGQAILCTFRNTYPAIPGISVEKTGVLNTGTNGVAGVGDTINYTITVRNSGNVTLRNVTVTERDLEGLSPIVCPGGTNVVATLDVGQSVRCTATYALTQADIDAGYVPNFAIATGTPPQGDDVTEGDDETVPITTRPELDVEKTGVLDAGANGVAGVGDTINYTVTVRNSGNVTLRNVRVTEQDLAGISAIDCGGTSVIATLRVGRSVQCTATYEVTQANVDAGYVPNFAIATGTPPRGPDVTDGDTHVEPIVRGLALRKTARPSVVTRGSTVTFRLRVANTSQATARGVRVCDTQPRGFTVVSAPGFRVRGRTACRLVGTLRPGRSETLVFTARVGAGAPSRVTNTATATSRDARRVQARARVRVVGRPPSVTG